MQPQQSQHRATDVLEFLPTQKPKWTEERDTLLIELWAEDTFCRDIANRLGGVTPNAVIGRARRLHKKNENVCKPRDPCAYSAARHKSKSRPIKEPMADLSRLIYLPRPHQSVAERVIALRDAECKWPVGDPEDEGFHFCGDNRSGLGPYCAYHAAKAVRK